MSEEVISLKHAVEQRLAAQVATDPTFADQLAADPDAVIKPLIAELTGDDGEIDLSGVSTTVHIERGNDLHFVVAPEVIEFDEEVAGFSNNDPMTASGLVGSWDVDLDAVVEPIGALGIRGRTKGGRCTHSGHRGTKCCYTM